MKTLLIRCLNAFFYLKKKTRAIPEDPKRILICNIASFGDVVISTNVIPLLKERYPRSELGFLTSSQAAEVLKDYPQISTLHTLDHWYANRKSGLWKAFFQHIKGRKNALKEMKKWRYDLAIDLYPIFWMSVLPLLSKANIPVRIGYAIQGYENLLTHSLPLNSKEEYVGHSHLRLLRVLKIDILGKSPLPAYFSLKLSFPWLPTEYVVVHMGTSYALKEWDVEKWTQVVEQLMAQGEVVVLTGKGSREQTACNRVASQTGCENYCDRLKWSEFASVVQHAKWVISVDSVAVHLASAVQIPVIVLFAGISSIPMWKPSYPLCRALMKKVPCAPCLNRLGCKQMSCIQEIQVEDVMECVEEIKELHASGYQSPCHRS